MPNLIKEKDDVKLDEETKQVRKTIQKTKLPKQCNGKDGQLLTTT